MRKKFPYQRGYKKQPGGNRAERPLQVSLKIAGRTITGYVLKSSGEVKHEDSHGIEF